MSPGWKGVIDQRRKESFVGRQDHLRLFSNNFETDPPAHLLFFVVGEGGVGKTTLLGQYEELAAEPGVDAIVVLCDDAQPSPAAAMGHIAEKLAEHGVRFKEFDERYKAYRAHKEEVESDPKVPRGALNLVVRGMTDFAIKAARRTPGIGVFAEYVDEKEAGDALTLGVNYLMDRIGNRDEVQLLREPERTLTPLFVGLRMPTGACEETTPRVDVRCLRAHL